MKYFYVLLLAALVSVTAVAQDERDNTETYFPQQLSAKELLIHCASSSLTDRGRRRQRYCAGFVSGIEEAVRLLMNNSHEPLSKFCIPPRATARQFKDAYIRYAGRPNTDLGQPAALVVVKALQYAYSCPQ